MERRLASAIRACAIGSKFAGLGLSPKFWPVQICRWDPMMNALAEMMLGLNLI